MHSVSRVLMLIVVMCCAGVGRCRAIRRVCYYSNWAQYRDGVAKFYPENVDVTLCTHVVYAFARMSGNQLAPYEWNDDSTEWSKGMYERLNDIKKQNPSLKTLLAVGGWNFGPRFTTMLSIAENRQEFVSTTIAFLRKRNFDGLDLDFEYPGSRGSPADDKYRFTSLIQELRAAYETEARVTGLNRLLLSAAVGAAKATVDNGYEVQKIAGYLDFINLMSYDLHGAWDAVTGFNAPLYAQKEEMTPASYLNVAWAAEYWVSLGAPREKLNIGMATYGRCFTLANPANYSGVGAAATGPCQPGRFTKEQGFLSYYEICQLLSDSTARSYWSDEQMVPYLVFGENQWVGYDNVASLIIKAKWAMESGFGGWMTWVLDLDDFSGTFCNGGSYPLMNALNSIINTTTTSSSSSIITTTTTTTTTTTIAPPQNGTAHASLATASTTTGSSSSDIITTAAGTRPKGFSTPTTSPQTEFSCADKDDGYYTNPTDCRSFYRCVGSTQFYFDCPSGLYWNDTHQSCAYFENLHDDRQKQCAEFS